MGHSRIDTLCSRLDCQEFHLLETMAATMLLEGYGALGRLDNAVPHFRKENPQTRAYWIKKADAVLKALEQIGVTVIP